VVVVAVETLAESGVVGDSLLLFSRSSRLRKAAEEEEEEEEVGRVAQAVVTEACVKRRIDFFEKRAWLLAVVKRGISLELESSVGERVWGGTTKGIWGWGEGYRVNGLFSLKDIDAKAVVFYLENGGVREKPKFKKMQRRL
jgi:hypothetical protein